MSKTDTQSVKEAALAELQKEKIEEAKGRIKAQLRIVEKARTVYQNEQRVLDDLLAQIDDGN